MKKYYKFTIIGILIALVIFYFTSTQYYLYIGDPKIIILFENKILNPGEFYIQELQTKRSFTHILHVDSTDGTCPRLEILDENKNFIQTQSSIGACMFGLSKIVDSEANFYLRLINLEDKPIEISADYRFSEF